MSEATATHRLEGFEADNPLAFLALLGLLRALQAATDQEADLAAPKPRASWELNRGPIRPRVHLATPLTEEALAEQVATGVDVLAQQYDFDGRMDLDYSPDESRAILSDVARTANASDRDRADLFAALMTDGAVREKNGSSSVEPTPFCFLFGQGHQHFLHRLATVPKQAAPPTRERTSGARTTSAARYITDTLFLPWERVDPTDSFRWDPEEASRYALMAGDPTDERYKTHTQHGANRLAAIGLATLSVVPQIRGQRVRATVLGGQHDRSGFSFAWPLWSPPMTLAAIRALLSHPDLLHPERLAYLGVTQVMVTRRISVAKFMNFTRADPILASPVAPSPI